MKPTPQKNRKISSESKNHMFGLPQLSVGPPTFKAFASDLSQLQGVFCTHKYLVLTLVHPSLPDILTKRVRTLGRLLLRVVARPVRSGPCVVLLGIFKWKRAKFKKYSGHKAQPCWTGTPTHLYTTYLHRVPFSLSPPYLTTKKLFCC